MTDRYILRAFLKFPESLLPNLYLLVFFVQKASSFGSFCGLSCIKNPRGQFLPEQWPRTWCIQMISKVKYSQKFKNCLQTGQKWLLLKLRQN